MVAVWNVNYNVLKKPVRCNRNQESANKGSGFIVFADNVV